MGALMVWGAGNSTVVSDTSLHMKTFQLESPEQVRLALGDWVKSRLPLVCRRLPRVGTVAAGPQGDRRECLAEHEAT